MEKDTKRKQLIKKIAGIFLVVMLVLTFFFEYNHELLFAGSCNRDGYYRNGI